MLFLLVFFFALAWWLGLYLLNNSEATSFLRWIGVASLVSALLLASQVVMPSRWSWLLLLLVLIDGGLGIVIARRTAAQWGEAFVPSFLRALDGAFFHVLLFALPIAITMAVATGATLAMRILLLITIAAAVVSQIFAEPIQSLLDRLAISVAPVRNERAALRSLADALPRVDASVDPVAMPEEEFVRLTRRALSQYGDLAGLASSPLTRLPIIEQRLAERNAAFHTLERTTELKSLLLEAIQQLKPSSEKEFDTSDAWRHYNSLYFPYVVGLHPYNNRSETPTLDATGRHALEWLRNQVPQRTLHNWQNSAAKLVATYLRELKK